MNIINYIRVYTGYLLTCMSYRILFYILSQMCEQVDEIIANDNFRLDGIEEISTTHKYSLAAEIANIIKTRGGQVAIVLKPEGIITLAKNLGLFAKLIGHTVVITVTTPLAKGIGFLVLKFPAVKKVYTGIKAIKVVIASIGALLSLRLIARFDYWALILSDALPQIPIETKSVLSGLRRLRMGEENFSICIHESNNILTLVMDEAIPVKQKEKVLSNLFEFYQMLPENHLFKNRFFACIVYLLLALFVGNKIGFKLALRLLYRLLKEGKISIETYREILSQLVIGGIPVVDIEIV